MKKVRDYTIEVTNWTEHSVDLRLDVGDTPFTTKYFPQTYEILSEKLPDVLNTVCHNPKNLPFNEHVKDTVLGHMFEHILIEYLCHEKIKSGADEAEYSGVTVWDWTKDKEGVFHINIKLSIKEENIFFNALKKALELFEEILSSIKAAPAWAKATH